MIEQQTMDSLPCEILIKIIATLPINEILKCKCVCRKWQISIDNNLRLDDLVVSDRAIARHQKWYFNPRPVDCFHLIRKLSSPQLIYQPMLRNLKQLYVNTESFDSGPIGDWLSSLKQLQSLQIKQLSINEANCILSLPNLTHLNLENIKFNAITLDTVRLSHLRICCPLYKTLNVKFNHPATIRHLELINYQASIMSLRNLEYFYCARFDCVDGKLLQKLPNLKEIHFNQHYYQKNDVFGQLKEQNRKLKRNVQIYNFGLNLSALPTVKLDDGSMYVDSETTQFICDNYHRLSSHVPFMTGIDYSVLANHFVELPVCFTSRFVNIDTVKVSGKTNAKQLISFLKNYRNLKGLHLSYSLLKQRFFDILPYLCPNLLELNLSEGKIGDFSFLLKFPKLFTIDTNQQLSYDMMYAVLRHTNVRQFFFYYENEYLAISHDCNTFKFGLASEEPDEFSSLDEMFDAFKEMIFFDSYQYYLVNEFYENDEAIEVDDESISQMDDESTIGYEDDDNLTFSQLSNIDSDLDDDDYYLSDAELTENDSTEPGDSTEQGDSTDEMDNISVIFDSDDEGSTLELDYDIEVTFSEDEDDL